MAPLPFVREYEQLKICRLLTDLPPPPGKAQQTHQSRTQEGQCPRFGRGGMTRSTFPDATAND